MHGRHPLEPPLLPEKTTREKTVGHMLRSCHHAPRGEGHANRAQNYILEHARQLVDIPISIVHGRFDNVCPMYQADELVHALKQAGHKCVTYRRTPAGHSMVERENCYALTDILDHL